MTAHSLLASSSGDLLAQVQAHLASGFAPTLAVVFADLSHDVSQATEALTGRGAVVIGATTSGVVADGMLSEAGTSALLLDLPTGAFEGFASRVGESFDEAGFRLGARATALFADPVVLLFAAGVRTGGDVLLWNVGVGAGRAIPVLGGMAGSDFEQEAMQICADGQWRDESVCALILDRAQVQVDSVSTSGWKPVGIGLVVTAAHDTLVTEIDGRPVLEVYDDYLALSGGDEASDDEVMNRYFGAHHPLSVERSLGSSVLRAPVLVDRESGGLLFAGHVEQGASVRFCLPPSSDVVERVLEDSRALHARSADADAVLVVSCKARHTTLGPFAEDEARALSTLWNAPQIGYFAYGEFGALPDSDADFHNSTCTLIALRVL